MDYWAAREATSISVCCRVWLFATPGSVAHQVPLSMGILQARILEWVAMPSSRDSSQPRDQPQVSCIAGGFFTMWATREAPEYWSVAYPFTRGMGQIFWPSNRTGVSCIAGVFFTSWATRETHRIYTMFLLICDVASLNYSAFGLEHLHTLLGQDQETMDVFYFSRIIILVFFSFVSMF